MTLPVAHSTMPSQVVSLPSGDHVPSSGTNNLGGVQNALLNENNFFQLLTAQLENQDPLNTMSASDFAAQLAQFSTAIGVQNMAATQTTYGNMQLSGLVGQQVAVKGNGLMLSQNTAASGSSGVSAQGAFTLSSAATKVMVTVTDSAGNPLQTITLGPMTAGTQTFTWDGSEAAGGTATPGNYQFSVSALDANGNILTATPYSVVPVTGVSLGGSNGPLIDLGGGLPAVGLGGIYQVF